MNHDELVSKFISILIKHQEDNLEILR